MNLFEWQKEALRQMNPGRPSDRGEVLRYETALSSLMELGLVDYDLETRCYKLTPSGTLERRVVFHTEYD